MAIKVWTLSDQFNTAELNGNFAELDTRVDELEDLSDNFLGYDSSDMYGVEVDYVAKTFTRIAGAIGKTVGANFNAINAFGGRKRCNLSDGGIVLAYYGDSAYTETGALTQKVIKNSVTYPIGTKVQVMVEQPKFYYKVVPLELEKIANDRGFKTSKMRYCVSDIPRFGFKTHPAFVQNGSEKEFIYLSAFEASIYDVSASAYLANDEQVADFTATTGDKLCSIANVKPCSGLTQNLTRANTRTLARNRGTGWQLHNIHALSVTQLLFTIEYASMNMQEKLGIGVSKKTDNGSTNMAENTGGTSTLGNTSGSLQNINNWNVVSYRGEENLYGNIWNWLDGINIEAKGLNDVYVNSISSNMADDIKTNYSDVNFTLSKADGYISKFGYAENSDFLFLPAENSGASNLPVGDYFWQNHTYNGFMVAILGGAWSLGSACGAFALNVSNASSSRSRFLGGRLLYVPQ